jgi:universal stress protein A
MEDLKRILVVAMSTKYCRKAVHYGISLAKKYNAELHVLHVIHNPFGLKGWNIPIPSLPVLEKEYEQMFEDARAELSKIIELEKGKGLPIKETVVGLPIRETVVEGRPMKKIFEIIEEEKIDLLVMIAYEEGLLEHWLFGRTKDEITRKMPCSVLLVRKEIGKDT